MNTSYFNIADHRVCLATLSTAIPAADLLPSFFNFRCEPSSDPLFTLTIDDSLRPAEGRKRLRSFDTGNGDTIVYMLPDGGYQYIIRDIMDNDCCLLVTDADFRHCRCALNGTWTMRSFGLNNALMLAYAFSSCRYQTLLVHASVAMVSHAQHGWLAFPFIASSGTGKSTHTSLWMRYIEGAQLLNDDNPILRVGDGGIPYVYGSPWSGKTPCYRQRKARLGALTRIERAPANSIERLAPVAAFASLLPACSSMKWDTTIYNQLCDTITQLIETTPVYTLHCLPDEEAARLCHNTIVQ